MSKPIALNLNYLWEQLVKAGIILQRPAVQMQIFFMAVSILLAWLISRWSWIQFKQRFPKLTQFEMSDSRLAWQQYSVALIRYLLTPTLSLIPLLSF